MCHVQCDQILLILNGFGSKSFCENSENIRQPLGPFIKMSSLVVKQLFWRKLGYSLHILTSAHTVWCHVMFYIPSHVWCFTSRHMCDVLYHVTWWCFISRQIRLLHLTSCVMFHYYIIVCYILTWSPTLLVTGLIRIRTQVLLTWKYLGRESWFYT